MRGYEWIQFSNPSDKQTSFNHRCGFTFNIPAASTWLVAALTGPINHQRQFRQRMRHRVPAATNEIFQFAWVGAKYGITRDLDLIGANYLESGKTKYVNGVAACNSLSTAGSNRSAPGYMDAASVALDWRFLPKWDAYIGVMYSVAQGGVANGDIQNNNLATTGGVRFRF